MSAWFAEYAMFVAKTLSLLLGLLIAVLIVAAGLRGSRSQSPHRLRVRSINAALDDSRDLLEAEILDEHALKIAHRARKKALKAEAKARRSAAAPRPRVFVLRFDGDIHASAVSALREEITALLQVAQAGDEVLLRLHSPGGAVSAYGLAAAQLSRIRSRGLRLTVAIDQVAASGGYMMACVADHIIAAPFAVVGSIGVVAQLPNFNRVLRKHEIDVELHTAGEFKRTLTVFGENTDEARAKFRAELDDIHSLFKHFVQEYRPALDIAKVATGEHWYGRTALELGLVDALQTVDDYLLERRQQADLFKIEYRSRQGVLATLLRGAPAAWLRLLRLLRPLAAGSGSHG